MGINITAILPIEYIGKSEELINLIEGNKIKELNSYAKSLQEEDYSSPSFKFLQWFVEYEKVKLKPNKIGVNTPLEIPQELVFRFSENAVEIWSYIRAFMFIKHCPKSKESLINVYKKVGEILDSKECWIMGDNNPICHAFREGEKIESIAKQETEKEKLDEIYIEIEERDTYDIIGFHRMKI